jgi:hypothetical protein
MDARTDTKEWEQLITTLGEAEQNRLLSDDDGRSAAIIQLRAILIFLHSTNARAGSLTTPLWILLNALCDLRDGAAKPAKILEPTKSKGGRQCDDLALRTVKIGAAVIMDQLQEYAGMKRHEAASAVAKVFSEFGLSKFRGRNVSTTTVAKWRDWAKEAAKTSALGREYRRRLATDAEALAQAAPQERKRAFLLERRLPILLVQFGAQGRKADKARLDLIERIQRRIPQKHTY